MSEEERERLNNFIYETDISYPFARNYIIDTSKENVVYSFSQFMNSEEWNDKDV